MTEQDPKLTGVSQGVSAAPTPPKIGRGRKKAWSLEKIAAQNAIDRERKAKKDAREAEKKEKAQLVEAAQKIMKDATKRDEKKYETWDSAFSIKDEEEIRSILVAQWGVTRPHFLDILLEEGKRAAERNKIKPNHFYWANGPLAALASMAAEEPLPLAKVEANPVIEGEISYRTEIFALWQFVDAWREDGNKTFDDLLKERHEFVTSGTVARGNKYFGKDFHNEPDGPHGRWDAMFVQWKPTLTPGYTQQQMKEWLGSQSEDKTRLLLACRNSYKSTFTLVYLTAAVVCCPDIRILLVSETNPLSQSFIEGFRSFFEIKDPYNPTRFQRLFREYCIPAGQGSVLTFDSPMAHLDLFQPTATSISMESGGAAGRRSDLIVFDDPISINTVGTEAQRAKSVSRYDALLELIEVGGYIHVNATPWHEDDLSARILERDEKAEDKTLLYIIDPAWTLLETGKGKNIFELKEEDVHLMFPARLTWKVLQKKLRDGDRNARTFRMQSLCMFLPEIEEDLKLQFDRASLMNLVELPGAVPSEGIYFASSDFAFTKSATADNTSFSVFKIWNGHMHVVLQESGQWREGEKIERMIDIYRRFPQISRWIIEKYSSHEGFDRALREAAMRYGLVIPVYWSSPTTGSRAANDKFLRIKRGLQLACDEGIIHFVTQNMETISPWILELFNEMERLSGSTTKHTSSIKDDRCDALAQGCLMCLSLPGVNQADKEAREKMEMEQAVDRINKSNYNRIFGSEPDWKTVQTEEPPPRNYGWPTNETQWGRR